jgi:hypothetical protein
MAKQRIQNYVFLPGVSSSSNAYPNAYSLLSTNKEFLKAETKAYINAQIAVDTASNLYPNAVTLLTNNKAFIIDEIIAWVAYRVTNNISPFVGYTYSVASCRRDTSYLIDALIYDIRYGGNEQTIDICKNMWQGGAAQLISPTQEIAGFTQIFTIITNFILPKTAYTSQQSPVTSTQNITGTAGEAAVPNRINSLRDLLTNSIPNGLSVLPPITYSLRKFAGYAYNQSRCDRDIGMLLDAYLYDLRYGGNFKTRYVSSKFWNGVIPQIVGDRQPEITAQTFLRDLVINTVFTQTAYTPLQTTIDIVTNGLTIAESGSSARITSLSNEFLGVLTNGLTSMPALTTGVTTIKLQGKYKLDSILLITNTTSNQILYNFSDPSIGGSVFIDDGYVSNDFYTEEDFPSFRQTTDHVTTLILGVDTSTGSVADDIQIFVEAKEQRTRPYDYGTDAIERQRVAQPQSMLDADFEYGLQPTKWQAIGISRGYPSVYEVPGTDTPVLNVTTDASAGTGGTGESTITVTTSSPHGFTVGMPFTIKALANSISGFSRAEGTFLINTVPTTTSFTYYAVSKVGSTNGQVLATTYTQLRKGSFYTGSAIGTPTFAVYSNGSTTTLTTQFITTVGSDQLAFTGTPPAVGAPLSGSASLTSGSQVAGVVGPGGIALTANIETSVSINDTVVVLTSASGVLEGMAIDNGAGTAIFVSNVSANTVSLTGPIVTARLGNTATYSNISGTNILVTTASATFNVSRVDGEYQATVIDGGTGYIEGNRIVILGTSVGGATPLNDLTITVSTILAGVIQTISVSGTSISGNGSYTNVTPNTTTSVSGAGATFDVTRSNAGYGLLINQSGTGFLVSETLTILGISLDGLSPDNDLVITVDSINVDGGIVTYSLIGVPVTSNAVFGTLSGTNVAAAGTNAQFNITRSNSAYSLTINDPGIGYFVGDQILILGTSIGGATSANDATILVTGVTNNTITSATILGTSVTGVTLPFYSAITISELTSNTIANGVTLSASAIGVIEVTFLYNHGLVPGASISVDITSTGTNHSFAKGPSYVESVPTPTSLRFTSRASGTIDTGTALTGIIYTRSDSYFIHRPYDGGVMLSTGGPQHGAQAIRMSKKYIRYQSGKGINYCTGALFAPSFNIQTAVSTGITIGSVITITMDDVDHGCQIGGVVKISNIDTMGFNGVYTVTDVISERVFRVQAQTVLARATAEITTAAVMSILKWHGSTVRAGTFDDQNGIFMQYDGQTFAVGKRTSTLQLAGVANLARDTNLIIGTNSRYRDQVIAGDRIVIKGMTHIVTKVISQTQMTVNPDYRGASNAVQAKLCLVQEYITPQSQFNIDKLDGTGPSGFNLDITKMQMIGMQWSWYAVGFIDYMLRGSDGNFIFFHRIRNSNVNTEAYMRTGNQAVRYEVVNESAKSKLLSSITASQTTIPLADATNFPNEAGLVYIDNELINFSGKSNNNLIGCTRAAPQVLFTGGAQRTFTAGPAATHEYNTGVILVSTSISPIISHWGSAMMTDGNFDTDRGYIFNYASTGISVSTTKATAFLIRLAPSVSNAIIGDLGDRELLNRAQLLLQTLEVTSDTGTGGIVVEGVLNPQNYPTDPANITWGGLAGLAQGGQPSFAQIAPGGSVSWSTGATQTTATATTSATMTTTITTLYGTGSQSFMYITSASWTSSGAIVGATLTTNFPAGTTITGATNQGQYYFVTTSQQSSGNINPNISIGISLGGTLTNTNFLYFTQASWVALGATVGQSVSATDTKFPAGTRIQTISTLLTFGVTNYYKVTFTQTSNTGVTTGATIAFTFGQPPYALPGETVFSFIAAPGATAALDLRDLKELTNTTLGGRGTYPNGPDVLAINVYKVSGTPITANLVLRWGEAQA